MKRKASQPRKTRQHHSANEKAGILREHRRSGLSLLAFARKNGLCYASLLRWRSRQRRGASLLVPPGPVAGPRFVPVKIESEAFSVDYVLSWTGGRSLKIPPQFEPDSLRRLLTVLEEAR